MKIVYKYTNEEYTVLMDDSLTSYYLILKVNNTVVNDIKFEDYQKAKQAFIHACKQCDNYIYNRKMHKYNS